MKSKVILLIISFFTFCQIVLNAQDSAMLIKKDINITDSTTKKEHQISTFQKVTSEEIISLKSNSTIKSNVINYKLKNEGFVTLKIFDIKGKVVASIINRSQKAGNYYANFSTFNLSRGIYQYELSINDKKMPKKTFFVNY